MTAETIYGWAGMGGADKDILLSSLLCDRVEHSPFYLEIDPTNYCNYRCQFCDLTGGFKAGEHIRFDSLQKAVGTLARHNLKSVRISGGGEPLAYPHFTQMVALITSHSLIFDNLTTNARLLDEEKVEAIIRSSVREINVSLNYANADLYARFMQTTPKNFQQTVDNIKNLTAAKRASGSPTRIKLQFFAQKSAVESIPQVMTVASEAGVDEIFITDVYNFIEEERLTPTDVERAKVLLTPFLEKKAGLPFEIKIWASHFSSWFGKYGIGKNDEEPAPGPESRFCYIPWYSLIIDPRGNVMPCCILQNDPRYILGNIYKKDVMDLWNGTKYRRFRKEMTRVILADNRMSLPAISFEILNQFQCVEKHCFFNYSLMDGESYGRAAIGNELLRKKGAMRLKLFQNMISQTCHNIFSHFRR